MHEIDVRVDTSGLKPRARKSYIAPRPEGGLGDVRVKGRSRRPERLPT
jgi:hypothetical protein